MKTNIESYSSRVMETADDVYNHYLLADFSNSFCIGRTTIKSLSSGKPAESEA